MGDQFQINTYTTFEQAHPEVAFGPDGEFVVVWQSRGSSGGDVQNYSVQARRYAPDGTPLGSEFQVNTYTPFAQEGALVSVSPNGGFVVVWSSDTGPAARREVRGRRFDPDGIPLGDEFQVNTYTIEDQIAGQVSIGPGGEFVVVWTDGTASPTADLDIKGRRYAADGTALGDEFQINTSTTEGRCCADVVIGPNGDFVAVWQSEVSSGDDDSGLSVHGRRYGADGVPLDGEFQINSYTTGDQRNPRVGIGPGGEFLVVWHGDGSFGDDDSDRSIQGRRYGPDGTALGVEFQINTYTTSFQSSPSVSIAPGGEFAVVWASVGSSGSDDSSYSIQGRRFEADGTPLGDDFQVNTFSANRQHSADVAFGPDGNFVVVWDSLGSHGTDHQNESVQGQRYVGFSIFADGFESGNTSAWSGTVP